MSYKINRDAPVKFSPTPPAFELKRNTTKMNKKLNTIQLLINIFSTNTKPLLEKSVFLCFFSEK